MAEIGQRVVVGLEAKPERWGDVAGGSNRTNRIGFLERQISALIYGLINLLERSGQNENCGHI